jgi:FMN reductase
VSRAPRVAVLVGNPKPGSRTLTAATRLARQILAGVGAADTEPYRIVDLAGLGATVLDRQDPGITDLVTDLGTADLVVVASPTYKGAYTGLLKLFLDRFPGGTGLRGLAIPLMLGAGPGHALAPELILRPVLTELGATVPGRGLYVVDRQYDDPDIFDDWLAANLDLLTGALIGSNQSTRQSTRLPDPLPDRQPGHEQGVRR